MNDYLIDEEAARRAKNANSFSDYVPGSATEEYRRQVDSAARIAEEQKRRVDPIYHEKIDRVDARVPSILITGGGNFPVRKKEKQNAARDANLERWREIQKPLEKIRRYPAGAEESEKREARNGERR